MNNNPNQPREFDAVLGGKAPPPINGVVLGGLEGVKHRLKSSDIEVQIATLSEALNYGKVGLDIVIETLQRSQGEMQHLVARLLREKGGQEGKQFLLNYDPWLFFTTLENWTKHICHSPVSMFNYRDSIQIVSTEWQIKNLVKGAKTINLEALACMIVANYFYDFVSGLADVSQQLPNLKALFMGDDFVLQWRHAYAPGYLGNIHPILKAFPQLEVLHLCGRIGEDTNFIFEPNNQEQELVQICKHNGYILEYEKLTKHNSLKTLIVRGADLTTEHILQFCKLEYPSLEYLELCLGRKDTPKIVKSLSPILSGQSCPNLLYLGLIGSNNTNAIATAIAESPIIERLKVLDLGSGNLSKAGVLALLNCPAANNLHALNVSENRLKPNMIEQLSQLKCQVIADSQFPDRYYSVWE